MTPSEREVDDREKAERYKFYWEKVRPLGQKGEWWYQQLKERYDLERRCRGKGIAINLDTGEYTIADKPKEALELARATFDMAPLFATHLVPWGGLDAAIVQIIEEGRPKIFRHLDESREQWLDRESDRLYEIFRPDLEKHHRGEMVFVDVNAGRYVIAETIEELHKFINREFSPPVGTVYQIGGGDPLFPGRPRRR